MGFLDMFDWSRLLHWVLRAGSVLLCIIIHEMSHGVAALALGDPTAKRQHRLSLNPLRHLDPFGLLMMLFVGFGWAKPVPVDMRYFKHPKSGMALTALAGPLSNFLLAFLLLVFTGWLMTMQVTDFLVGLVSFLASTALLSIGLGVFNLIPFPPLDGSKILGAFLPDRVYYTLLQYERYGMFLLILVFWFGGGSRYLSVIISTVLRWFCMLTGVPYWLFG